MTRSKVLVSDGLNTAAVLSASVARHDLMLMLCHQHPWLHRCYSMFLCTG